MCYSGLGHTLVSRILIPNKILTILQPYTTDFLSSKVKFITVTRSHS